MKQTAVEWLQECLQLHLTHEQKMQYEGLFQQAKAMEKDQIIEAFEAVRSRLVHTTDCGQVMLRYIDGKQYYNETYKPK